MKCLIFASMILLGSIAAYAEDKGNGGDSCENKIISIRDEITSWIDDGGHKNLQLPNNISHSEYAQKMRKAIKNTVISCSSDKLTLKSVEKTCKNYPNQEGGGKLVCNFNRFNDTGESNKFKLIHHEYAGISELESNDGHEESRYFISNQLSKFMRLETTIKLAIKPIFDFNDTDNFVITPFPKKESIKHLHSSFKESFFMVATFNRELPLWREADGRTDDDIYFQEGQRVQAEGVDRNNVYCQIDTDFESNEGRSIKKGQQVFISDVSQEVDFQKGTYIIWFSFSFDGLNDEIDSLECEMPLEQMREYTYQDILNITDSAFNIDSVYAK